MTLTFRRFAYPTFTLGAFVALMGFRWIGAVAGRPPANQLVDQGLAMLCGILSFLLGAHLFALVDYRKKRSRIKVTMLGAGQGMFLATLFFYSYLVFGREITLLGCLTGLAYSVLIIFLFWKIINAWNLSPVNKTEVISLQLFAGGITAVILYLVDGYLPPTYWFVGGS